jgi:aerobic carbon-monoxide dehydrogenase medium subunit
LAELERIREENGELRVGALTRQRAAERDPLVRERCPLLAQALPWIGHAAIRNRGTIGGSLAHADPAAELPAVVTALDATIEIVGDGHTRTCTPAELFVMPLVTSLEPDELIVGIRIPPPPSRFACAWVELAPRHGDFALAGVAVALSLAGDGTIERARLVLAGVGPVPVDARDAAAMLTSERPSEALWASAAEAAVAASDPRGDVHATADYRRRLVRVLVQRALRKATA